jgi:hypothetical protein
MAELHLQHTEKSLSDNGRLTALALPGPNYHIEILEKTPVFFTGVFNYFEMDIF